MLGAVSTLRRSLLDSADVYPRASAPENRLTEIFAEVLRTAPDLVSWLASQAFAPTDEHTTSRWCQDASYEVVTQFSIRDRGERPHMRIRFTGVNRPKGDVFYIENKLDARPTAAQGNDYAGAEGPVIVILPDTRRWREESRFVRLSWAGVAREISRLGRGWADEEKAGWPDYAMRPDAPSQYRMLAELSRYLEREIGVTVPSPLTPDDLLIVPRARAILDRWDRLFDLVQASLTEDPGLRKPHPPGTRWEPDRLPDKQTIGWDLRIAGSWPALERYWKEQGDSGELAEGHWVLPSFIMAPEVTWEDGPPITEPAIGTGLSVRVASDWPMGLREDQPFRAAAKAAGFTFGTTWKAPSAASS